MHPGLTKQKALFAIIFSCLVNLYFEFAEFFNSNSEIVRLSSILIKPSSILKEISLRNIFHLFFKKL
jgi:hypothetical protein